MRHFASEDKQGAPLTRPSQIEGNARHGRIDINENSEVAGGRADYRLLPHDHRSHGKGGHFPAAHTHREWIGWLAQT